MKTISLSTNHIEYVIQLLREERRTLVESRVDLPKVIQTDVDDDIAQIDVIITRLEAE